MVGCRSINTDNKAPAMVFVEMLPFDKELWINTHLAKLRGQIAFQ
jgi:hypothetical protein